MESLALSEHPNHDDDLAARKLRLFEGIRRLIPPSETGADSTSNVLSDEQYTHITGWCESNGLREWGKRPRTLVILHMVGCLEAMDGFISQALSDIALPYSEENLPRVLRGAKRAQFLAHQQRVLSEQAIDLERKGSSHSNIDGNADVHFYLHRELGSGGFGTVDHVFSRLSLQSFARKRIPRGRSFKKDQDAIRMFENELKTLKALSHRHLVRLVASYTDRKFVGLIMTPVADMDMQAYLAASKLEIPDRSIRLRRFFGCLATAVEYLHQQKIRHKDIKPQNILIKDGRVLLTDFGTSRSWADDAKGTTMGTNKQAFTKAYCAPEVAMHGTRNNSSDLWSLGCVFLDMCTVLAGKTVLEMRQFFANNGTAGFYLRDNEAAARLWINHLKNMSPDNDDNQVLELVLDMCNCNQEERPSATETVSLILDFEGQMYYDFCCDREQGHHESGDADLTTMFYPQSSITSTGASEAIIVTPPAQELTASDVSVTRPNIPASDEKAMFLPSTNSQDRHELDWMQVKSENDVVGQAAIPSEPNSDPDLPAISEIGVTGEVSDTMSGNPKIAANSSGEGVDSSMNLLQSTSRETLQRELHSSTSSALHVESSGGISEELVADVPQPLNMRESSSDDQVNPSYTYSRYMLPGSSKSTSNVLNKDDPSSPDSAPSRTRSDTDQLVSSTEHHSMEIEVSRERATNILHSIGRPISLERKQALTASQNDMEHPARPVREIPEIVSDPVSLSGPTPMLTSKGGQQAIRTSVQESFTSPNEPTETQLQREMYHQPVAEDGGSLPVILAVRSSTPMFTEGLPSVASAQTAKYEESNLSASTTGQNMPVTEFSKARYKAVADENKAMEQRGDSESQVLVKRLKPIRHIASMGSFLFRWPHPMANDVYVTGTFDDWSKSVQLDKVGDVWVKNVEMPMTDEKVLYRFVVNDEWIIDPEAHQLDDGHGNLCNVLYPQQIKPQASAGLEGVTPSRATPENITDSSTGNFHPHSSTISAPEPSRYNWSPEGDDSIDRHSKPPTPKHKPTSSELKPFSDFLIRDAPSPTEPTLPPSPSVNKFAARKTRSGGYRERSPPRPPPPEWYLSVPESNASSPTEPNLSPTEPITKPPARKPRPVVYQQRLLKPSAPKTSLFERFKNKITGPKNPKQSEHPNHKRTRPKTPKQSELHNHTNDWDSYKDFFARNDNKDDSDRWSITADANDRDNYKDLFTRNDEDDSDGWSITADGGVLSYR